MDVRRLMPVWSLGLAWIGALTAVHAAEADEKPSALKTAAAAAERVVIAVPQHKAARDGKVDVPPGGRFAIEIQSELRGSGNNSVLIVNGGDQKQYPRYVNGKPYVFLLKRNPEGKGWLNLGASEIPIRNGRVQWLVDGKVAEELPLSEFEEFAASAIEPVAEKVATREVLTGNWFLVTSDSGSDRYLWLVEFVAKEGEPTTARIVASSRGIETSLLKSAEISGSDVRLVFSKEGAPLDFKGRFVDGMVRGTVVIGNSPVIIARLEPTDLTAIPAKYEKPQADPNHEEFLKAVSQDNPTGALTRFVRRHPSSSLAISGYQALVSYAVSEGRSREDVEKLADEYRKLAAKWGPRMEHQALVDLGGALSVKDYLPDLALEYLTAAHERFGDDTPLEIRKTVEIERGRRLIAAGQAAEGVAVLAQVRAEHPFDPIVLYSLARQAEKDKRTDEALALYGQLQVLPMLEQSLAEAFKAGGHKLPVDQYPRRLAARLWIEKHGDGKGLPEWLEALYASSLRSLAREKQPPRKPDEGNRIVLCELFTNVASQQCVAAEAAVTSLEAAFDTSEVVVLRYHVHDPSADPLGNEEGQDRCKMYVGSGTPLVILSGHRVLDMGGSLPQATSAYHRLREATDSLLKERTELKIELSAQANQGKISVSARAAGLSEFPPSTRLIVALTEDRIDMPGKNGVRTHERVVRAMPAGPGGIGPVKGVLAFTGDFELAKLKKHLARQIDDKESGSEVPFDAKPVDLAALHFVAFLQSSETGEIYQAAATPVAGLQQIPSEARSPGAKPAATKPAEGKPIPGEKSSGEK